MDGPKIDLDDYILVTTTDGSLVGTGDNAIVKNLINGQEIEVPYFQVAAFYGLEEPTEKLPLMEVDAYPLETESLPEPTAEVTSGSEATQNAETSDAKQAAVTSNKSGSVIKTINVFKWNDEQTKYMLHLYSKYMGNVGPLTRFRTKKLMWAHIAKEVNAKFHIELKGIQVETRYKCVFKRTKEAIDNNNRSGATREETEYDEEIGEIVNQDDSIAIDTGLSAGKLFQKSDLFPRSSRSDRPAASSSSPSPSSSSLRPSAPPRGCATASEASDSDSIPNRRQRKPLQEIISEKMMNQRDEQFAKFMEIKEKKEEKRFLQRNRLHEDKLKVMVEMLEAMKPK